MPVLSGVPQGSILGPLLFILFINDLPDVTDCDMYLYADDAKIMVPIYNEQDCAKLQQALHAVVSWSKTWGLTFNPSKCRVISFTKARHPVHFDYHMNGSSIDRAQSISDLGVTVTSLLDWSEHISSMCK